MNNGIVSLTFDDGWSSQYDQARPILDRYNIKATFYIITSNIRATMNNYFGPAEIRSLQASGHEIGAHTVNHPDLVATFPWKIRETYLSRRHLASIGVDARSFAYPYGRQNRLIRWWVKWSGFHNSRVIDNSFNGREKSRWQIGGKLIRNTTTISQVQSWLQMARERNYLLVLIFHRIEDNPSSYDCTPSFLDEICQLLVAEDLPTLPLSDGWKQLSHH